MFELLIHSLTVYALAAFIVEGHILDAPRSRMIMRWRWMVAGGYHLLECRFCVGFWVAAALAAVTGDWHLFLPSWGAAHFLRKLEKEDTYLAPTTTRD